MVRSGQFTKHFYIESQRIVSKLGETGNNGNGGGNGSNQENFQYYYHPDHLGSSSYISDVDGEVAQHVEYFPFGETFLEEHSNTDRTPYLFNGKELDEETGLYYYGARYYDARTSVWQSIDPLWENYPGWSPYAYTLQNPIKYIDPDGQQVMMAYNKTSKKLVLIDKDHYKQGLPTKIVTAKGYKLNGIRDDKGNLTHNQILVMKNVFSGGESNNGNFVRDPNNSKQKPIPNGKYDLLEYEKRSDWFKLDAQDESRYDDVHDKTGRDGFRLHKGTLSYGCVTADSNSEGRNEEWNVLMKIINSTTTEDVPKREGKQKYIPWGTRKKYGYLKVYGIDLIPDKVIPNSNGNNNGTQNNE